MSALYPLVLLLKGNKGNNIRETKTELRPLLITTIKEIKN